MKMKIFLILCLLIINTNSEDQLEQLRKCLFSKNVTVSDQAQFAKLIIALLKEEYEIVLETLIKFFPRMKQKYKECFPEEFKKKES